MKSAPAGKTLRQAVGVLAELLGVPESSVRSSAKELGLLRAGSSSFVLHSAASGAAGPVAAAAEAARGRVARGSRVPLVVVPFMGEAGRQRCEAAGVSWFDLSGNARIVGPGLRIIVQGQPNRFARPGRPASVFAPKGARIARQLLMNVDRRWSQRELAQAAHVDEGYVSRIVARLAEDQLVVRNEDGTLRARDPGLLLDAWAEAYRFEKHHIIRGHVAARSGDASLREIARKLREAGVHYAATGLGAAWLLTHFAGFRLASFYVQTDPSAALLDQIGFREEERGANVWLIVPDDEGVFQGAAAADAVVCVHPVQVFLDLGAHPERASEAAAELRKRLLMRSSNV